MKPKDREVLEAANIIKSYCAAQPSCYGYEEDATEPCVMVGRGCCGTPAFWALPDIKKEEEAHD